MGKLTYTVTAPIASFRSADKADVESLKLHFLPIQEGSGDPSPSNVRNISGWTGCNLYHAGKNLWSFSDVTFTSSSIWNKADYTIVNNDVTITAKQNGATYPHASRQAEWNIPYALRGQNVYFGCVDITLSTSNENHRTTVVCEFRDANNGFITDPTVINYGGDVTNPTYARKITIPSNAAKANIYFRIAQNVSTYGVQVGDYVTFSNFYMRYPTESHQCTEPYSGEKIPITFPVMKNLLDIEQTDSIIPGVSGSTITISNGVISIDAVAGSARSHVKFSQEFPAGTYTIQAKRTGALSLPKLLTNVEIDGSSYNSFYGMYAKQITSTGSHTFTLSSPSKIGLVLPNATNESGNPGTLYNIQLEEGSSATPYMPYKTLYGGYIDLIAGEIVEEYALAIASKNDFGEVQTPSSGTGLTYRQTEDINLPTASGVNWNTARSQQMFNLGAIANPWSETSYGNYVGVVISQNKHYMRISEDVYQAMGNNDYAIISYKLETPVVYHVTPQQMKTFLDRNNFWSDMNDTTEVEYAIVDHLLKDRMLIGNTPHLETSTGTVATFSTDLKSPLKECKISFAPIQDGTGDPSPQNIRPVIGWSNLNIHKEGQNLINKDELQGTQHVWWKGKVTTGYPDHCVTPLIPVKPGATYYLYRRSVNSQGQSGQAYVNYFGKDGTTYITQENWGDLGSYATHQIPDNVYYVGITVGTLYKDSAYFQLVDQPYEYTNYVEGSIIPVVFPVMKNLFDPSCDMFNYNPYTISGDVITQSGSDGRGWTTDQITPIHLEAGTYSISCSDGQTVTVATSIDEYATTARLANGGGTITLGQDCYIKMKHSASSYPTSFTLQIEKGSSITAYEPYRALYGGYIDLVQGKIVAEYEKIYIKNRSWYRYTSNQFCINTHKKLSSANLICDTLPVSATSGYPLTDKTIGFYSNGTSYANIVFIKYTDSDNVEDFKAWLQGLDNDPYFVYELQTPIEYPLTAQQIKTLKGMNNIWADTNGNITVKYWTH